MTCLHQIKLYDKRAESLTFDDITSAAWANGFVKYLLSTTSLRTGRSLNPSTVGNSRLSIALLNQSLHHRQ